MLRLFLINVNHLSTWWAINRQRRAVQYL